MISILILSMLAHSWYPIECCSEKDCEPIDDGKVIDLPEGYLFPNGQTVPYRLVKRSPDGKYHWCRYEHTGEIIKVKGKYCVFIPFGDS
jgi:hypothetical protein